MYNGRRDCEVVAPPLLPKIHNKSKEKGPQAKVPPQNKLVTKD
jgi:hypothetical protein